MFLRNVCPKSRLASVRFLFIILLAQWIPAIGHPSCESQYGCFADRQYQDFLAREAEPAGHQYYVDHLCNGTMTPDVVVRNFIASPEFTDRNGFISRCYFAIFNNNYTTPYTDPNYRIPEYAGITYWNDVMKAAEQSGDSVTDAKLGVIVGFTNSPEWLDRVGSLDDWAFVGFLYQHILGRDSEPAGHQYHFDNLQSGAATRDGLILEFLDSPEAQAKYANHTYVVMAYLGLLQRGAEKDGFDFHMNTLETGAAEVVGFLNGFLYAPEYINRLAGLGCIFPPAGDGTITIEVTPDNGSWTLTGPAGSTTITGSGDRTGGSAITNAPAGDYTLTCDDNVANYNPPAPRTQTLAAGGTLPFTANYTPEGGDTLILNLPDGVSLEMVRITGDSFLMGRYPGEQNSQSYEDPQHTVTIGYDFYLGKYQLTKEQWEAVMGTTPWSGQSYVLDDPQSPAVWVSWNDIVNAGGFLETLNTHLANTGQGAVRLPSEAEWEYSCRAGTTTRFYWGDDPAHTQIGDYAWYYDNAHNAGESYAHIKGQKLPNAWGLYDMSGNVYEWCQDYWHDNYNDASRPDDGSAWESPTSSYRVVRGGGWFDDVGYCRSAGRNSGSPGGLGSRLGLRLVWTQN